LEWGRAKTILIISFLCLNILLAYQLWINKNSPAGSGFEIIEIEETHQLLRDKGIRLEKAIPKETPTLREIEVQYNEQYQEDDVIKLKTPVENNILINKAKLEDVLAEEIPHAELYQVDPIFSENGQYVLDQLYNHLPMFEINLKLYSEGDQIYAYSQSLVEVEPGENEKEQKILSAYKAVGFLAENYLQFGAVIRDVTLGYHGQIYDSETQVLAPKWRIALEGGDIYYVHGINGAVDPPQKE
jgi:regulatory protein YycI of two-component signal transduction system YycFG